MPSKNISNIKRKILENADNQILDCWVQSEIAIHCAMRPPNPVWVALDSFLIIQINWWLIWPRKSFFHISSGFVVFGWKCQAFIKLASNRNSWLWQKSFVGGSSKTWKEQKGKKDSPGIAFFLFGVEIWQNRSFVTGFFERLCFWIIIPNENKTYKLEKESQLKVSWFC